MDSTPKRAHCVSTYRIISVWDGRVPLRKKPRQSSESHSPDEAQRSHALGDEFLPRPNWLHQGAFLNQSVHGDATGAPSQQRHPAAQRPALSPDTP